MWRSPADGLPGRLSGLHLATSVVVDGISQTRPMGTNWSTADPEPPYQECPVAVPDHLVLAALNSLERQAAVLPEPANVRLRSNPLLSAAGEIDNARLCRLLRNEGADEERSRIARDLHDRMGEALALLGFEMDLVLAQASPDSDAPGTLADDLRRLRGRQREVVQELRNILHDARAETSAGDGPAAAVAQYAERMTERTGLRFDLELDARLRLPAQQEREVCRIAQEAMTNVERHARATSVKVSWVKRDGCAELRVLDDGRGFTPGQSGRRNTYGLLGMRERASVIGATLSVEQGSGQGTLVRCSLPVLSPETGSGAPTPEGRPT